MTRRSTPQKKIDERSWPVRILIEVPEEGLGQQLDAMMDWLAQQLGRTEYAQHAGPRRGLVDTVALYFRHPHEAVRFLDAFPGLVLADGTTSPGYTSPALPFGRR